MDSKYTKYPTNCGQIPYKLWLLCRLGCRSVLSASSKGSGACPSGGQTRPARVDRRRSQRDSELRPKRRPASRPPIRESHGERFPGQRRTRTLRTKHAPRPTRSSAASKRVPLWAMYLGTRIPLRDCTHGHARSTRLAPTLKALAKRSSRATAFLDFRQTESLDF